MSQHHLADISTSDTFGVEWTGQSGNRYRLINRRRTTTLTFGALSRDGGRWNMVPVENSARFKWSAPTTHQDFVAIARRFIVD